MKRNKIALLIWVFMCVSPNIRVLKMLFYENSETWRVVFAIVAILILNGITLLYIIELRKQNLIERKL